MSFSERTIETRRLLQLALERLETMGALVPAAQLASAIDVFNQHYGFQDETVRPNTVSQP